MTKQDCRLVAQQNELRILKMLFKFGFLRTRDIAALCWMPARTMPPGGDFNLQPVAITASALRMAQITLRRLNQNRLVYSHTAPDSSLIYGLSEAGARMLQGFGIPASSGADWLRRFSPNQYHHRRISNEIAVCSMLLGYRVASEREIATGQWYGGMAGINGKKPDVLIRSSKCAWWVEVERSQKTKSEYAKLVSTLDVFWPGGKHTCMIGNQVLSQFVFVSNQAFIARLKGDLKKLGWDEQQIFLRIFGISSLYVSEVKFLKKQ